MKSRLTWLLLCTLAALTLLTGLSALALADGPVLTVIPTPTPARPAPGAQPGIAEIGPAVVAPDLVVTSISLNPAVPKIGQPAQLSVTIKNAGPVAVSAKNNFNVDLYIDPPYPPKINYHQITSPTLGLPWGVQWFSMPVNGSITLTTTWVFTDVKTYDIWAMVDSGGDVDELYEYNNVARIAVSAVTSQSFTHTSHQDFMTNMASTLDNSDPSGMLQLGTFVEPPFLKRPFTDGGGSIVSTTVVFTDYNMISPDTLVNPVMTGSQIEPYLYAAGNGVLVLVWEDHRNGEIMDGDIYIRMSTDGGETWGAEMKVNDDPGTANQLNPVVAVSDNGNLLVAWQDKRNGDYDIYVQRYVRNGAILTQVGNNILAGPPISYSNLDQINPDITVDDNGSFFIVWQDNRDNNYNIYVAGYEYSGGTYVWSEIRQVHDDPFMTQQSNPAINAIDWKQVVDITYDVGPPPDYVISNIQIVTMDIPLLAVVWEDYRSGNADIGIAISNDGGETFGFDQFVTTAARDQLDPQVILTTEEAIVPVTLQAGTETATVNLMMPVTGIHTVWQDFQAGTAQKPDPDIYYSRSELRIEQRDNLFYAKLSTGSPEKINTGDTLAWQTGPVVQRDPQITAIRCAGATTGTAWNKFIVWSDARNYDNSNYDIYYTLKSDCGANIENRMVNDGVHLYNFDRTKASNSDYNAGSPPPAWQVNPTIATDICLEGSTVCGGYLYVVWEDDRAGDPQKEKDLYFARSNLTYFNKYPYQPDNYGAGSQISSIFDSGNSQTTWYTVNWEASTDHMTYMTIQTRLGNTITEVLNSAWYPDRFPFQPQPYDPEALISGMPFPGYNAPGQHIEDSAGNFWPKARYIQYRVNLYTRDETKTPEVDNVTIHYQTPTNLGPTVKPTEILLYIPAIYK